jgi:hypothetical protein
MQSSEQNKLLRVAASYLDDATKAAEDLEGWAERNVHIAESAFEQEITPMLENARSVIGELLAMGSEGDDFAEVDKVLSKLSYRRAGLCDTLVSGWRRFKNIEPGQVAMARFSRLSQAADLESLLMSRDAASLYITALGEVDQGRVPVALHLLLEVEEHWGDDDVGTLAVKKRRQYQANQPGTKPEPLGIPGGGKLLKELCARYPAYGRSSGVALRQLSRAVAARDPEYVVALLGHYESTGAPSRLLADLLVSGFKPVREVMGVQMVTDWGLRWSKNLSPSDRQRVSRAMRDDLLVRLAATPGPSRGSLLELLSEGEGEELTAWFQNQVEAVPDRCLVELGESMAARLGEPHAMRVRAATHDLIMALLPLAGAADWPLLLKSLSRCGEMREDDALVFVFAQLARDVAWVPVGAALVKLVRGAALERVRTHTVSLALDVVRRSEPALWPPLLDHLFAVDPGGMASGAALADAYAKRTARPNPELVALGTRIAASLKSTEAARVHQLVLDVLFALLKQASSGQESASALAIIDSIVQLDSGDATCARLVVWFESRLHDDGFDLVAVGQRLGALPAPHGRRSTDLTSEEIIARLDGTSPEGWSSWLAVLRALAPGYAGLESKLVSAFQKLVEIQDHSDDPLVAGDELVEYLPKGEARIVRDLIRKRLERLIASDKRSRVGMVLARRLVALFPEDKAAEKQLRRLKDRQWKQLIVWSVTAVCLVAMLVVSGALLWSRSSEPLNGSPMSTAGDTAPVIPVRQVPDATIATKISARFWLVNVSTNPTGAAVFVADEAQPRGKTTRDGLVIQVPRLGRTEVIIRLAGYKEERRTVNTGDITVAVRLTRAHRTGNQP